MNFFSSNIKVLRKKSGLRQSEIPECLGYTRTTWSNYENGISQPSIEGLLNIARFFSVSVSDLVEKPLQEQAIEQKLLSRRTFNRKYKSLHLLKKYGKGKNERLNITSSKGPDNIWQRTTTW